MTPALTEKPPGDPVVPTNAAVPVRDRFSPFWWAIALMPAAVYLVFLLRYSRNIPTGDDYVAVLPFLSDWHGGGGLLDKLGLFHAQYFSHRIAATRLVALLDCQLFGAVSFQHLQWCGWLCWGVAFTLLLRAQTAASRIPAVAAVLALLLMHPVGHTNFLNGMQAVQNLGIIVVALLVCLAARSDRIAVRAAGLVLAAVAPWVSANGLIVGWAAATVALAGRNRRLAGAFVLVAGAAAVTYFQGFQPDHQNLSLKNFLGNATAVTGSPLALLRLGLEFAIPVGAVLLTGLSVCLLRRESWERAPGLCGFALFVGGSIGMLAYGRMDWGMQYVLNQDRYKLYGLLTCATLFLFLAPLLAAHRRSAWLFTGAIGVAAAYCGFAYFNNLATCSSNARWAEVTALNRQLGMWFICEVKEGWPGAIRELERAEQVGCYRLPKLMGESDVASIHAALQAPAPHPAGTLPVNAWRNVPHGGEDLSVKVGDFGGKPSRFALVPGGEKPVVLAAGRVRLPLGRALRTFALVDDQQTSYFLPDALGLSVPAHLLPWPAPTEPGVW